MNTFDSLGADMINKIINYLKLQDFYNFLWVCKSHYEMQKYLRYHNWLSIYAQLPNYNIHECFTKVAVSGNMSHIHKFINIKHLQIINLQATHLHLIPSHLHSLDVSVNSKTLSLLEIYLNTNAKHLQRLEIRAYSLLHIENDIFPSHLKYLHLNNCKVKYFPSSLECLICDSPYNREKLLAQSHVNPSKEQLCTLKHLKELTMITPNHVDFTKLSSLIKLTIMICNERIDLPESVEYLNVDHLGFNMHLLESSFLLELIAREGCIDWKINTLPSNLRRLTLDSIIYDCDLKYPSSLTFLKVINAIDHELKIPSLVELNAYDIKMDLQHFPALKVLHVCHFDSIKNFASSNLESLSIHQSNAFIQCPSTLIHLSIQRWGDHDIVISKGLQTLNLGYDSQRWWCEENNMQHLRKK